jgi:glutathione synthase
MTSTTRSIAFVMDPLESIDITGDTTFVLMLEAQQRGHDVYYIDPMDLGVDHGSAVAVATPVTLRNEPGNHVDIGEPRHVRLDEAFDVVMQRKDPPVDAAFVTATQILSLCRNALVLNRPTSILTANEKLYTIHFPELMTDTLVSRRIPQLLDFMEKQGGEMIVKPLDGKGGEGIFHVQRGDRNTQSILEQATSNGSRWIMAQRYLPEVRRGDKRILLLDGEPIGAVLRVPPEHEVRSNLHVGGQPARTELDENDRKIIAALGPVLRRDGFFFVGIDVIGGYLTEINVTSPTGVQEVNRLEGRRLEATILDGIEAASDEKSR